MSSSTKKQLRREQVATKKAEARETATQEKKRMKLYTSIFCVVLALMLLLVAVIGVNNSGIIEPRVTALKVGDSEITASELNVYYINAILDFYESAGSYLPLYGLKTETSLDKQLSMDTVNNWDVYFINSAEETIHYLYSIYNEALADETFTETERILSDVQASLNLMDESYKESGINLNDNLRSRYGKGVTKATYQKVMEVARLANEYYNNFVNSLSYTDDEIAAFDAKDPVANNLYNYSAYILYVEDFLEGGTQNEDGTVTYSDEEKAAALAACESAAKFLSEVKHASAAELEAAAKRLPIHEKEGVSSTMLNQKDVRASSIAANMKDWVTDAARQPGDIAFMERESTINGETSVSGYNVVFFEGVNDNTFPLVNVRHILVSFEGGTTDPNTGAVTYSDDEKAAAKAAAQEIYDAWLAGDATANSFAALAEEKSADAGSKENGGLYNDVYPGRMLTAFNDWCFAEGRQVGDHGMVETESGYHIMLLDSFSETSYREYLITNDMMNADVAAWQEALMEKYPLTELNLSRVDRKLVLGNYLYYGYGA